jgi:hypothetical protein
VTFNDGATAFGSFDYDATTQSLSNLDITTTPTPGGVIIIGPFGSVSGGHHWLDPDGDFPPYPAIGFGIVDFPIPADLLGVRFLGLGFASPLTNAGGTIAVALSSGEGFCTSSNCAFGQYMRLATEGSVIGSAAVPEPATLTLTGLGLAACASRYRRRRSNG